MSVNYSGWWRADLPNPNEVYFMQLVFTPGNPDTMSSQYVTLGGIFNHNLSASWEDATFRWNYTDTRTSTRDVGGVPAGCSVDCYGYIEVLDADSFNTHLWGSNGLCNERTVEVEQIHWLRAQPAGLGQAVGEALKKQNLARPKGFEVV